MTQKKEHDHPIADVVVKLTKFYYSPWSSAKGVRWECITDMPIGDESFVKLLISLVQYKDPALRQRILEVLK